MGHGGCGSLEEPILSLYQLIYLTKRPVDNVDMPPLSGHIGRKDKIRDQIVGFHDATRLATLHVHPDPSNASFTFLHVLVCRVCTG